MKSVISLLVSFILVGKVASQNEVQPYPDNSLYVEQYQQLGMPSPDEIWNGAEFKRAVKVIKGYYNVDKWSIPRKDSEYSGALFNRMVAVENFEVILDKSVPLQERLREHDEILNGLNQFLNLYFESSEAEQRFGAEVLSLFAISSKSTTYSIEVITELQTLMSGRGMRNSDLDLMHDKLVAGVATTIDEHYTLILEDYQQYTIRDIELFSKEICQWIFDVQGYLSESELQAVILKTQKITEKHPNKTIQLQFKDLHKKLSAIQKG